MNNLKMYTKDDREQEKLISTVKTFSNAIKMQLGLDKCAKGSFHHRKVIKTSYIILDSNTTIKKLHQKESYKYLEINERDSIQQAKMKEHLQKKYQRRVRPVIKSELEVQKASTPLQFL